MFELHEGYPADVVVPEGEDRRPSAPLLTVGRAILGGYFLYNGVRHFLDYDDYAAYAASKDVPAPHLAVAATGAMLVAGGLSLLTGVRPRAGAALIDAFLIGVTPMMHDFWKTEGEARQGEQINFMKNVALAGAGLMAASIPEPWPVSLDRRDRQTAREAVDPLPV